MESHYLTRDHGERVRSLLSDAEKRVNMKLRARVSEHENTINHLCDVTNRLNVSLDECITNVMLNHQLILKLQNVHNDLQAQIQVLRNEVEKLNQHVQAILRTLS